MPFVVARRTDIHMILDDRWANTTGDTAQSKSSSTAAATQKVSSTLESAKDTASGVAKTAYETATGKKQ